MNKKIINNQDGMTLIEVMAVVMLIALLYVVIGKNVFSQSSGAKAQLNVVKMNQIKGYLGQYRLLFNVYPSKLDDLVRPPADIKKNGLAFTAIATDDDLKDVYGNPFSYITDNGGRGYVLKTLGEDGQEGGEGAKADVEVRP